MQNGVNEKKETYCYKSEFESKIISKKNFNYILMQECKQLFLTKIGEYYIPNMNNCSIVYLKDALNGKKR